MCSFQNGKIPDNVLSSLRKEIYFDIFGVKERNQRITYTVLGSEIYDHITD